MAELGFPFEVETIIGESGLENLTSFSVGVEFFGYGHMDSCSLNFLQYEDTANILVVRVIGVETTVSLPVGPKTQAKAAKDPFAAALDSVVAADKRGRQTGGAICKVVTKMKQGANANVACSTILIYVSLSYLTPD